MPVPGARELLPKRRESDEQRVGERFGKVTRVELVGCKQQGEPNLEQERRIEKAGELKGDRDREHTPGQEPLREKTEDWESRCGQRGYKAREMQEEVDNNSPQTAGCYSRSRKVAALKRGWRKTRKAPERKGKRRGSWGDSTEERRRAVRDKGRFGRDTSVQLSQDKVGSQVRTRKRDVRD